MSLDQLMERAKKNPTKLSFKQHLKLKNVLLNPYGTLWINIGDTYSNANTSQVPNQSLCHKYNGNNPKDRSGK
jgi:hypothetical protein